MTAMPTDKTANVLYKVTELGNRYKTFLKIDFLSSKI